MTKIIVKYDQNCKCLFTVYSAYLQRGLLVILAVFGRSINMGIYWTGNVWMLYYYALYTCSSDRLSTSFYNNCTDWNMILVQHYYEQKNTFVEHTKDGKEQLTRATMWEEWSNTLQDVVLFRKTHLWTVAYTDYKTEPNYILNNHHEL